jgi:hypothetical protein
MKGFSCHLSCVPKQGDPKKGTRRPFLSVMLGRPRYISETRPSGSDSPKCFTLGLGRMPGMVAWDFHKCSGSVIPQTPHAPGGTYTLHSRFYS